MQEEGSEERVEAWRNSRRRSRSQENRFNLELGPFHDVGFWVGPPEGEQHLVTCHKLMLARCSEVFSAMFFGGAEVFTYDDDDAILVPDVTPAAFDCMVDYVYTGELCVEKFQLGCELMVAAHKYRLPELQDKCRALLWARLYPHNVWRGLEFASRHHEPQIHGAAMQILQRRTSTLLEHRSFEMASLGSVVALLDQDCLTVDSELELYEACLRWARAQLARRDSEQDEQSDDDPGAIRTVLGPAVQLIRFLTFSAQEFALLGDEILTEADVDTLREDLVPDGLCTIIQPRIAPSHGTFCTIGFSDESCQLLIDKEYFENTYDVFALAMQSNGDFCSTQLGVQVGAQVRPRDGVTGATYAEDLTVLLYDWSTEQMLCVTRFTADVEYDSVIDIPFARKIQIRRKRFRKVVKVIFHKSGIYPSRYLMQNYERDSEVRRGRFADTDNAELWHEKSFGFVRFCAYTVDSEAEEEEEEEEQPQ